MSLIFLLVSGNKAFAMEDCSETAIETIQNESDIDGISLENDVDEEMETNNFEETDVEMDETAEKENVIQNSVEDSEAEYEADSNRYENKGVYDFIVRMYDKFLDRQPDPKGLDEWYNLLVNHQTDAAKIVDGFTSSDEFRNKNLSTKEYLTILYNGILGRTPDSTGMAEWSSVLSDGVSRKYVCSKFVDSIEFEDLCERYDVNKGSIELTENRDQNLDITRFVTYFYRMCLDREGDASGLNDWTGGLLSQELTGADIAHGFLFSKEFCEKNLSNEDYLEILYQTLLSRHSDPKGKADWLVVMDNGVSNKYIMAGFVHSDEFSEFCQKYNIKRGNVLLTEARDKNYELTSTVCQLYKKCFDSMPTGDELNEKMEQLYNGELSGVELALDFLNSDIYKQKNLSNEEYISDIYHIILKRDPSGDEINAALNNINAKSRKEALERILITKEYSDMCRNYGIELMDYKNIPAMKYAKEILDQVGWNMKKGFQWSSTAISYGWTPNPPSGTSHAQWYGKYGFENRVGNCYVMASTFYWMAKINGWEVYLVEGSVPLAGGGMGPHGWVEVVVNGTTYVCDPDFAYETGRNGYFITYGTSGTWRYSNYRRVE
ncbi:MAG: DUF4214 domain-containing protein [Frisingicoccus sp.]|nr:DUF4214 domain-containing protein [Frisingicoccus sp.]